MVVYNPMSEAWIDTEDETFKVSMTPEGSSDNDELEQEFQSQDDFYKWYNNCE